jgi:hypothetical protein
MADDTETPRSRTPEPKARANAQATPRAPQRGATRREPKQRWECRCSDPPILLARYDPGGQVQIKVRDRFYIASGCVYATCPRCGTQHVLDLRPDDGDGGYAPLPAIDIDSGWS